MNLVLIDNNYFKLTPQQASQLAIGNKLPEHGKERMADINACADITFGREELQEYGLFRSPQYKRVFKKFEHCTFKNMKTAWVTRTPLSYWRGKPVENKWTWALHVVWN